MTQNIAPDPAYLRNREAYQHLVYTLSTSLPPPPDDSPERLRQRDQAAIAQVAALCPANPAEAALAAQSVAANAQAMECLRLAHHPDSDLVMGLKCSAQAASMMRQSHSGLNALRRLQAAREKRDANATTASAAAWTEHAVAASMTDALTSANPEPRAAPAERDTQPAAHPNFEHPDGESPNFEHPDGERPDVELYEALYPQRAALIRRHGGVPADSTFGPPDEAMVRALIAAPSPALKARDLRTA